MGYELRADLSACRVDGHFIFLDIQADRYFHLTRDLEYRFARYFDGRINDEAELLPLLKRNILIRSRLTNRQLLLDLQPTIPARSAIEISSGDARHSLHALVEVAFLILSVRRSLTHRKLHEVLDATRKYRSNFTADSVPHGARTAALIDAARLFLNVRMYVPVEPICLLDSISLVRFLARRRLHSNIVFGVTGDPFSAHCWVQSEALVLNDTVGNARAYQPIRTL